MNKTKIMDLQQFLDTVPTRIRRSSVVSEIIHYRFPHKTEVALRAYAEHDALHYLFNLPFTIEGENHVAFLEQKFQRGWLPVGKEYNRSTPVPYECDGITLEMIDETARIIYGVYNNYVDREMIY